MAILRGIAFPLIVASLLGGAAQVGAVEPIEDPPPWPRLDLTDFEGRTTDLIKFASAPMDLPDPDPDPEEIGHAEEREVSVARDPWQTLLPIGGTAARERGYDLPPAFGLAGNVLYMRQSLVIDEVRIGFGGAPPTVPCLSTSSARIRARPTRPCALTLGFFPSSMPRGVLYYAVISSAKNYGAATFYLDLAETPDGEWLDGSKNNKLVMPPNVPVRDFWAITTYDLETASYIRDVEPSSIDSSMKDVKKNADGSVDIYFGPKPPKGKESNWLPTDPKRRFFLLARFYGEPALFDGSFELNNIEKLK